MAGRFCKTCRAIPGDQAGLCTCEKEKSSHGARFLQTRLSTEARSVRSFPPFEIWLTPNNNPVFVLHIIVDLNWTRALRVKPVASITPRAGDPVLFARLNVEMVPLVAALGLLKFSPAIFDRTPGLRERDAADA